MEEKEGFENCPAQNLEARKEGANEGSAKAWGERQGRCISWGGLIKPNQITPFPQLWRKCPQIGKTVLSQGYRSTYTGMFMEELENNFGQGLIFFWLAISTFLPNPNKKDDAFIMFRMA